MNGTGNIFAGWLLGGPHGKIRRDVMIHVEDGRIADIREADATARSAAGIDLREWTVMPGLVDAHLHLFMSGTDDLTVRNRQLEASFDEIRPAITRHLRGHLENGVLAVRDGGDYAGHALRYKTEQLEAKGLPVEVRIAGRAWRKPDRYGKLIGRPPEDGVSLANAIAAESGGIDHVKIVNSGLNSLLRFGNQTAPQFSLEELAAGVVKAHQLGLPVMVHCNGEEPVRIAIEAGADSIEHGYFMGDDNLKRLADENVAWIPTAIPMKAYAESLEPGTKRAEIARRNNDHQMEQIARARELGVRVAVGSDAGSLGVHHGVATWQELAILVEAGYSLTEAITCATRNGAELLKRDDFGEIRVGGQATFIALRCPPEDILKSKPGITVFHQGRIWTG